MVNKRMVITGAAGFIGANLCRRLLAEGHEIVAVDNFSTSVPASIAACMASDRFQFIEHDIRSPLSIEGKVDQIYNLACPASPKKYQRDPLETLETSIFGVKALLELAHAKQAVFLQASTSEVYGDPEIHPQTEDYVGHVNPIGPRACYDEGKRVAETYIIEFAKKYQISTKIVRIFNTYGPFMSVDDGRVVSNFITQALSGEPITIYGDGKQTRSFCYIDDLINGLMAMMASAVEIRGPVNLGNPTEYTIADIAQTVVRLTKSSSQIIQEPLPMDDPKRRRPDISRAKAQLGWQPVVALEEGLNKTIPYFQACLNEAIASEQMPKSVLQ